MPPSLLVTAVLLSLSLPLLLTPTTTHIQAQTSPPPPPPPSPPPPPPGPYNPTPLFFLHSTFVDGKALFVHGGISNAVSPGSKQTFSLDLSTSWKTSQPAFKQLTGGFPSLGVTSALLNDRRTWVLFFGNQSVLFDTQLGDWGGPKTIKELNPKMGFPAATDFTTNQVYVVNGYLEPTMVIAAGDPDPGGSVSPNAVPSLTTPLMMRYDGATGTVSSLGSGSGFQIVDNGFAGCWSSSRNSLFLHGGTVGSPVEIYQKTLYEFIPSNPKYTTIADTGAAPSARFGHCMVEAYGGTKMVLFGGVDQTSAALSDIYILDVEKLSWKAGKVGGAGVGRTYAACAVSNDMFVAWGGATRIGNNFVALTSNLTVVYNLKTGEWQSTFSPARVVIPTSTTSGALRPSSSIDEKTDDGSSSSGALMGGIVGGLAAIGAIAGLLVYRRRAARKQQKRDKKMSFSTYSALPVVATRAASSDDSLPGQSARNGKRDKDNEEDDGGGVVYIVEAAATSTSVTPRSLVGSYQQQQQQQANHDPAGGIPVLVPASEVASMASPTSTYAPPIVARPYMPQDRIIKIFEPSITYASPGPALPITSSQRPHPITPKHSFQQQSQGEQGYYQPPPPIIFDPTASPTNSNASTMTTGATSTPYIPGNRGSPPWVNTSTPSAGRSSIGVSPSSSTSTPLFSPSSPSETETRASVQFVPVIGREDVGKTEVVQPPRNPQGTGRV